MAVRTYYGTCTTESDASEKKVYVPDTDLTEQDFNFQEGDLLVVFFAQTNTVSEPSIVVYLQDPEVETSTTSDTGKYIKSLDVEANMENAWAAGETVVFAYTQQSTAESFYWELVDGNHASVETYGDTKLFDDNQLKNLLAGTYDGDEDIALTPNALKQFYDLLKSTEEEEEDDSPLKLKWNPVEPDGQKLGTLSLTNDSSGVDITFPLEAKVTEIINRKELKNITHTGQLFNNGNGADGEDGATSEDAEPFITRIVPENLYLNGDQNGIFYGIPTQANNVIRATDTQVIVGNGSLTDGILLNKFTTVGGNLTVNGTLTTTGIISATNANITTNGNVYGTTLYEKRNSKSYPLQQLYGPHYQVLRKNTKTEAQKTPIDVNRKVTLEGNKTTDHLYINVNDVDGYKPIGIVGYNISEFESNKGHPRLKNLWECCLNSDGRIQYAVQNLYDKKDVFYVMFDVLYQKRS